MTSARLALTALLHQKGRTLVSVIGAAFAVVLIFMQLGFLGAVENTASLLYGKMDFDLLLTSNKYNDLSKPGFVDRDRLLQARSVSGVKDVIPFSIGIGIWRNPTDDPEKGKKRWSITVMGVPPGKLDRVFLPAGNGGIFATDADLRAKQDALSRVDEVLMDQESRRDFGDTNKIADGTKTELNGRRVTYAGTFRAGTGFSYTGLLLTNEQTFGEYMGFGTNRVTFGLVQLQPGVDVEDAKRELEKTFELPGYLEQPKIKFYTKQEILDEERRYWVDRTALGTFFKFGVVLALTVGAIFIYQMMVADIKKHLPEYATLKAMGYRFGFLFRIVLSQSVFLAIAGFSIGYMAAIPMYAIAKAQAQLPIAHTTERVFFVLALTVGMCVFSGVLAVSKVRTADPADLF